MEGPFIDFLYHLPASMTIGVKTVFGILLVRTLSALQLLVPGPDTSMILIKSSVSSAHSAQS